MSAFTATAFVKATVLFLMLGPGMRAGVPPLYLMSHDFHDVHLFMYSSSYSAALEEHGMMSLNALLCDFFPLPALDLLPKYFMAGQKWRGMSTLQFLNSLPGGNVACIKNSRTLSLALCPEKTELLPEDSRLHKTLNIDLSQIAIRNL